MNRKERRTKQYISLVKECAANNHAVSDLDLNPKKLCLCKLVLDWHTNKSFYEEMYLGTKS